MPSQFRHVPFVSVPKVVLATFCIQPFLAGCAVGPPGGPLDFGLPPDLAHLLLVALAAAAVVVIWNRRRHNSVPPDVSSDTALCLLRDRYARGEIDRDEFLQRRRDLEEQRTEEARGARAR